MSFWDNSLGPVYNCRTRPQTHTQRILQNLCLQRKSNSEIYGLLEQVLIISHFFNNSWNTVFNRHQMFKTMAK